MWCERETKAINKLCVREILSLSFVCGAYFFEFRGRNLVCFGITYNFDWGRHMQIRAGSRGGTHAHCVFHARRSKSAPHPTIHISSWRARYRQNIIKRSKAKRFSATSPLVPRRGNGFQWRYGCEHLHHRQYSLPILPFYPSQTEAINSHVCACFVWTCSQELKCKTI